MPRGEAFVIGLVCVVISLNRRIGNGRGLLQVLEHGLREHVVFLKFELQFGIGLLVEAELHRLIGENLQFHQVAGEIALACAARGVLILGRKSLHQIEKLRGGDLMIADGNHDCVRVGWRSNRASRKSRGRSGQLGRQNGAKRQKNEGKFHLTMLSQCPPNQLAGSTMADMEPSGCGKTG